MQIHVAQLLKAEIGAKRDYEVNGTIDIYGDGSVSEVLGRIGLMRTNRGILVKGRLHTEAGVYCSRCLALFRCPLDLEIEEEYFPTVDVVSGVPVSVPEDSGFTIDEHHLIDLAEAVRQYALVGLPMKPLCRENCAGLCPGCGHNLNEGPCGCPAEPADPRWAVLVDMANKQKGTG